MAAIAIGYQRPEIDVAGRSHDCEVVSSVVQPASACGAGYLHLLSEFKDLAYPRKGNGTEPDHTARTHERHAGGTRIRH